MGVNVTPISSKALSLVLNFVENTKNIEALIITKDKEIIKSSGLGY